MSTDMRYIIDILKETVTDGKATRVATLTDPHAVMPSLFDDNYIQIMFEGTDVGIFTDYQSFRDWLIPTVLPLMAEPAHKTIGNHVNPSHYQGYMEDYQWLETINRLSRFQNNPDVFIGAVELQARKYLDRLGLKDNSVQDILKAVWYLKYIAAYLINDKKPILVKDIEKLINSVK